MNETRVNLKRQVEILGLVLDNPWKYKNLDLEMIFDCARPTIQRDLKELRKMGVDIHSASGKGIYVARGIMDATLRQLVEIYLWLSQTESLQNKGIDFLVAEKREKAVSLLVMIQKSIEERRQLKITYRKYGTAEPRYRTVNPLLIFEKENTWRLLADEGEKRKQFILEKIEIVKQLETKFELPVDPFRETVKLSFGPWIDELKHPVKLKFTKRYLETGKKAHLVPGQKNSPQSDGSIIVSVKVSSLEDVARWVVARGGDVIALAPDELKDFVERLARKALDEHTA